MPRKGDSYILVYAGVVCLAASIFLAAASAGLKRRQDQMAELDRKFNVLKAFQVEVADAKGQRIPGDRIEALYADHVREVFVDPRDGSILKDPSAKDIAPARIEAHEVLPLFHWVEDGQVTKYAFPVSGKGLWSTIYGYLALDRTLTEVIGITFYRHGETPGLGGEIEQPWFQSQFRDRKAFGDGHLLPIEIAKGKATPEARADTKRLVVDGISGATLTGKGVTFFLNDALRRYEKHFSGLRKG